VESTMVLQGGGLFTACEGTISPSGTSCHFDDLDSAANGPDRKYEAEWRSMIPESSTVITFCVDPDNNGCGDSGARDAMIKFVAAGPAAHVHVLETEQANGPHGCHPVGTTGTIVANVTSKVALTGCVFEESHVPDADARVAWELRTAGVPHPGGVDPARFGSGLDKRADDDGRALGVISTNPLASGHTTTVTFCRDADADGACGSGDPQQATLRISWTGKGCTIGSPGGDRLHGTGRADCLKGVGGADDLSARGARDFLFGGAGGDTLRGGGGADVLSGGPGFDVCYGQAQRDTFVSCERKRAGG
jgi:RTX calcium-binding nonapeptide repeat (4 copies)